MTPRTDIFSDEFLLPRPLRKAISRDEPTVLLIDEVDKGRCRHGDLLLCVCVSLTSPCRSRRWALCAVAAPDRSSSPQRRTQALQGPQAPLPQRPTPVVRRRIWPAACRTALTSRGGSSRIIGALRGLDIRKKPSVSRPSTGATPCSPSRRGAAPGTPEVNLAKGRVDDSLIERTLGVVLKHRP